MVRRAIVFLLGLGCWMSGSWAATETPEVLSDTPEEGAGAGVVVICPIEGMVDDGMVAVVKRAAKEAAGAKALVFVMDTPGGVVISALQIVNTILKAPCPTIVFIDGEYGAISAGALISFACNHIVMAPATNIGAAAPIVVTPQGILPSDEKEVSFLRERMAALAEEKGHNPAIGKAMVDKDVVLYGAYDEQGRFIVYEDTRPSAASPASAGIEEMLGRAIELLTKTPPHPGEVGTGKVEETAPVPAPPPGPVAEGAELISARGKLLTLTSKEAERFGLIPTTCKDTDEVLSYFGYGECKRKYIVMTWNERVFRYLTTPVIATVLLLGGLFCLYMEAKTPGFGLFGITGIICLALRFGAGAVLGLTEWIDLVLIVVGLGLLALELFVIPGFGIAGVAGIVCLLVGIFLSMVPNEFAVPSNPFSTKLLLDAGRSMLFTVAAFAVLAAAAWKLFPHTPFGRALILGHSQQAAAGYAVQGAEEKDAAVGLTGVATSMLRPVGRGRFGAETYPVVARGEFIEPGSPIVIVQVDGNRYVVEKAREKA